MIVKIFKAYGSKSIILFYSKVSLLPEPTEAKEAVTLPFTFNLGGVNLYDQFCTAVNLSFSILSVQLTMGKTNQVLCMYVYHNSWTNKIKSKEMKNITRLIQSHCSYKI
jgi:hypothetical protein